MINTMENTLIDKLRMIQKELKAPKSQKNSFGNYNYRSCEDILEAVKPLLKDCSLTISDEIVMIGDRYYVKARAQLTDNQVKPNINGEDKTSVISVFAFARESLEKKGMDSAQVTGAASSYARKYALNGLFLIDDTKDADTQDNTKKSNLGADKDVDYVKYSVAVNSLVAESKKAGVDYKALIARINKAIILCGKYDDLAEKLIGLGEFCEAELLKATI